MAGMFEYSTPFRSELKKMGYTPMTTNKRLRREVEMLFSHPRFKHREVFIAVNRMYKGVPSKRMAIYAFALVKYFYDNKAQFGGCIDNIRMDIIIIMWKVLFAFTDTAKKHGIEGLDDYLKVSKSLMQYSDALIDELIRTVEEEDVKWDIKERDLPDVVYHSTTGEKIKRGDSRHKKGRISMYGTEEGTKNFEKLCRLAEDECGSLL